MEAGLKKTAIISFVLHIFLLIIALVGFKTRTYYNKQYKYYTVNLVDSGSLSVTTGIAEKASNGVLKSGVSVVKNTKALDVSDNFIEDRISAIEARRKVEQIVKLRSMISIGSNKNKGFKKTETNVVMDAKSNSVGVPSKIDLYYENIKTYIWQQWFFPETGNKNLEVIVSIRINKDGVITEQRIDKSSGNSLFDRSAIRAIVKSSPLPPPPYEMEVGIRFYP